MCTLVLLSSGHTHGNLFISFGFNTIKKCYAQAPTAHGNWYIGLGRTGYGLWIQTAWLPPTELHPSTRNCFKWKIQKPWNVGLVFELFTEKCGFLFACLVCVCVVCTYVCASACTHPYMSLWRPGEDIGCLPLLFSILFLSQMPLTEPRVHQARLMSQSGFPGSS